MPELVWAPGGEGEGGAGSSEKIVPLRGAEKITPPEEVAANRPPERGRPTGEPETTAAREEGVGRGECQ